MQNMLYYGDNLKVLRREISDESIDLIYLDPPFNSNRNYNQIFTENGRKSAAQITVFEDTWNWNNDVERSYLETVKFSKNDQVSRLLIAMREFLGTTNSMAYLVMMAPRLLELQRVLKSTGSVYLHCDPTASHYLKLLMDATFGAENFRNEIVWKRTTAHSDTKKFGANIDILLFYGNGNNSTWNQLYQPYDKDYVQRFRYKDPDGRLWTDDNLTAKGLSGGGYEYEYKGVTSLWRVPISTMEKLDSEGRLHFTKRGGIRLKRYLDEAKGVALQALWDDIPPINSQSKERIGYPTQKPIALLERIIQASSDVGDVVLDPFCGCGTAIAAAEKLERKWIGIDVTHIAITTIRERMRKTFGVLSPFLVKGEPIDLEGANQLALEDRYQFQIWALSLLGVTSGMKKGADGGIDGIHYFEDYPSQLSKCIAQVKSGRVGPKDIRELHGVIEREGGQIGIFVTLLKPSKQMRIEAAGYGIYESRSGTQFPIIQIVEIAELLDHKTFLHHLIPG